MPVSILQMILRHTKRSVPQINTTSTADISFILLVFFLVMTSMDVDKGLMRTLPPVDADDRQEAVDVAKSNVLSIEITAGDGLLVDGRPLAVDRLRGRVASFVAGAADRRRHVILLDVDRRASYDSYFNVQNEIVAAYNALRDSYAVRHYGRRYAACTPEQREAVRACYPQRITETSAGGGEGGAR